MSTFEERIAKLNKMIADAQKIVIFTGAGISTGSGIPDFRSVDGLYSTKPVINGVEMEPEFMLSGTCLTTFPDEFFHYLNTKMNFPDAVPNIAHIMIAALERSGRQVTVVTQNIDNLHQLAGSSEVCTIHGSFARAYCQDCGMEYEGDIVFQDIAPRCECGGIIRPDVTLYGESLPHEAWNTAIKRTQKADLFIIIGSSMTVMPAGFLPAYFTKGNMNNMIIINRDPTSWDYDNLVFREDIPKVFKEVVWPKQISRAQ